MSCSVSSLTTDTVRGEMPMYLCHKKVRALKIKMIGISEDDGHGLITPEDSRFSAFKVDAAYMQKHSPQPGGYYVVYGDGYKSFSPADAFESGYTLIGTITTACGTGSSRGPRTNMGIDQGKSNG